MRTPNRTQWWPARWFTGLRLLAALTCLLVVVPAAGARPVTQPDAAPAASAAQALANYLNPDGTLNLPAGQAISLDPHGYPATGWSAGQVKHRASPRWNHKQTLVMKTGRMVCPFSLEPMVPYMPSQ